MTSNRKANPYDKEREEKEFRERIDKLNKTK